MSNTEKAVAFLNNQDAAIWSIPAELLPEHFQRNPERAKDLIDSTERIAAIAAGLHQWDAMKQAVSFLIACQQGVLDWWLSTVRSQAGEKSPHGGISVAEAEKIIRFSDSTLARWRVGLRRGDAYYEEITQAARAAAGLELSARAKRDKDAAQRRAEARLRAVPASGERYRLEEASVTALLDEPAGSIDHIVTDPPYPQEYLPLFGDLARGAAHVLRPGGLLLCMSGQSWLPRVYEELGSAGLNYIWTLDYLTPAENVQIFPRHVLTSWKPILMYCQGDYEGAWISDIVRPDADDKEHHDWGQAVSGFRDLMRRFVLPGQVVCDPFLGGGTTAVVALEMGAYFLGLDVDPDALLTTRARLADANV